MGWTHKEGEKAQGVAVPLHVCTYHGQVRGCGKHAVKQT